MDGNDKEIKVSIKLLHYMKPLYEITEELNDVKSAVGKIIEQLSGEDVYQGKSKEEMQTYFDSLNMHVDRLLTFYAAANTYLLNSITQYQYTDEQMARLYDEIITIFA